MFDREPDERIVDAPHEAGLDQLDVTKELVAGGVDGMGFHFRVWRVTDLMEGSLHYEAERIRDDGTVIQPVGYRRFDLATAVHVWGLTDELTATIRLLADAVDNDDAAKVRAYHDAVGKALADQVLFGRPASGGPVSF